ncbi:hypothetical protein ACLKA6_010213 [Drosophila palustris]
MPWVAEAIKKTRLREGGIKRWSDIEVKNMLDYVRSHTNFEKPTARLYYLKLLEETKIETKWNLARSKMRHLKALFVKANDFLNSTGAGVEDEDGDLTIQVVDDTTLESEPKVKKRRANSSMEKLYDLEEDRVALRREQLKHEQEKR